MIGQATTNEDYSIVALDKFIQATRDSGYKGTASAVSELVDNSLQAGAKEIRITLDLDSENSQYPIIMRIHDNGSGMDRSTLRQALRFGGSTRFNDRNGMGRYGMGLPNSSLSQAKRVTVHTWTSPGHVLGSYLDLDEIVSGELKQVPSPQEMESPIYLNGDASGTVVSWHSCDRIDNRRISTITRKLLGAIGRRFRHHIWSGTKITINGDMVEAIDPLYLHPESIFSGATQFGSESIYEVQANPDDPTVTGIVRVRFSELPVVEWSRLSNKEKRARGITAGAGVSVVRAGREVDYGWFFLGGKRRENYDDWWRCEIQFDPILDEAFGITHTKQQIRPQPHLIEALSPDVEAIARALSNRARIAHTDAKVVERFSASEERAGAKDELLTPLPKTPRERDNQVLVALGKRLPTRTPSEKSPTPPGTTEYKIVPQRLSETTFFNYARDNGRFVLVLNPDHPFYKQIYKPLLDSDGSREATLRAQIDLLLLSAARSEALLEGDDDINLAEAFRKGWSDTLATFLNG